MGTYGYRKYSRGQTICYLTKCRGIGRKTAEKLVARYGDDTVEYLRSYSATRPSFLSLAKWKDLLDFVNGGYRSAKRARRREDSDDSLYNSDAFREVERWLYRFDLTDNMIEKIWKQYGSSAIEIIKGDPYKPSYDIEGINFKTVDSRIARLMGIALHDPRRIRAMVLYLMQQESKVSGNVYSTFDTIMNTNRAKKCDDGTITREEWKQAIHDLSVGDNPKIVDDDGKLYVAPNYRYETYCAEKMKQFLKYDGFFSSDEAADDVEEYNECCFNEQMDEDQKEAIRQILTHRFSILTGGPGTGKTTIIDAVVRIVQQDRLQPCLAAPTGRAAKRMQESTGENASTIHRLLGWNGSAFQYNAKNPLPFPLVIVDEVSMIDLWLFYSLLSAIDPSTTSLLFVGDMDQLPSVGAGRVLSDLIESGRFSVVKLTRIHRQSEDSHICTNAQKINHGIFPENASDFRILSYRNDPSRLRQFVENIVTKGGDKDVQILAPTTDVVDTMNEMVQKIRNPYSPNKREIKITRQRKNKTICQTYREGDKIMQTKNVYDAELYMKTDEYGKPAKCEIYNGDIGVIQSINEYKDQIVVQFDEGRTIVYDHRMLESMTQLAYAMTIHKSQGSEFNSAIIILPTWHQRGFITRKLVYTAVTRAKKQVFLLGSGAIILEAISDTTETQRRSCLKERIQGRLTTQYRQDQQDEGFTLIPSTDNGGSIPSTESIKSRIIAMPNHPQQESIDINDWLFRKPEKPENSEENNKKLLHCCNNVV